MSNIVQQLRELYSTHPIVMESAAEIARLRALSQNNAISWDNIVRERDELRARVKQLALEIKEYRA